MVGQVDSIAEQEKEFPLLLHKHRTNIDKVTVETSMNYSELMNLIRAEMEKTNDATTVEMLSLLQGEFNSLAMLATSSEATMSKNFDDYKNMLYDQFGKVMTLERANLHNALAVWRDRFQHDQQKALNQQVKISQDVANSKRDLITNLQQQVSKFSMRLGLVLAEKKEMEGKIRDHEKVVADMREAKGQAVHQLEEAFNNLQAEHQQCADPAEVLMALDQLDLTTDKLATANKEYSILEEKHQSLQAEHQQCADPAEVNMALDQLQLTTDELVTVKQEHQAFQSEHQVSVSRN